jgi:dihydrofolate reductase
MKHESRTIENAFRALKDTGVCIKAIAAVDSEWGIGKNGNLLAHLPGDMKYFRETTMGKMLIMGRKTLESLPGGKPLTGRKTIVLTHRADFAVEGAVIAHSIEELAQAIERLCAETSLDEISCASAHAGQTGDAGASASASQTSGVYGAADALERADPADDMCGAMAQTEVFVAGGAVVYAALLPYTDSCLITKMDGDLDADVFFPNLDADERFRLVREDSPVTENGIAYRFTEYRRQGGNER